MVGGNDADAEVELLFPDGHLNPPVLGASALGDIHLRQNLDAGDDGAEEPAGRTVAFVQDAVNSITDADDLLERLDVDVRGPKLHRLLNHELYEADDGGAVLVNGFAS